MNKAAVCSYLSDDSARKIPLSWDVLSDLIVEASHAKERGLVEQPVKPYLHFQKPAGRIIAMPARVGLANHQTLAGIKWIASFPSNRETGLARAHSVTILNDANTGIPYFICNSAYPSIIRTAAVSCVMVKEWLIAHNAQGVTVGIIGMGPIGRMHGEMLQHLLGRRLEAIISHDLQSVAPEELAPVRSCIYSTAKSWKDIVGRVDILITATTSGLGYIDIAPKPGALVLNVSLRDFIPEYRRHIRHLVVDDWNEVCRENTDIAVMAGQGLERSNVCEISECLRSQSVSMRAGQECVMFNPMGLACYDVIVGQYFYKCAERMSLLEKLN